MVVLITHNRNRIRNRNSNKRNNSRDGNDKGARALKRARPFVVAVNAVVSVVSVVSVSAVCDEVDQVDQVVPAHQDDIDEVHELDPVHQVDHKDERCDDIGRFPVDIGRFLPFLENWVSRCASPSRP